MLSTRHQKQSTRNKQRKKKPKALENSTPNKVTTHLLRLAGNRWLVSLRLGESRQPGEEPTSSTALLLAVMQGEWRQQRRVLSPRGGVTVKAPQQGPTSFCRTEVCSLQHSSGMLQESSQPEMELPVGYCKGGVEEGRMHLGAETAGRCCIAQLRKPLWSCLLKAQGIFE